MNGLKKPTKYKESQWYAQSAHCAHTGHDKEKFCSVDVLMAVHVFTFGPRGHGNALRGL